MGQQVAHGELAGDVRIVQPQFRQVVDHLVVPLQLALVHEHPERGGRHRLGGGADGEARVLGSARRLPELRHAVALGEHQRVAAHHRNREPWYAPVACRALDVTIERRPVGRSSLRGERGGEQRDSDRGVREEMSVGNRNERVHHVPRDSGLGGVFQEHARGRLERRSAAFASTFTLASISRRAPVGNSRRGFPRSARRCTCGGSIPR